MLFFLVRKKNICHICVSNYPIDLFFREHVNYEEDKNKVPMNKSYNIQNTNMNIAKSKK
jgi:hypothetical protein